MASSDQDKNDSLISWVVIGIVAMVTFTGMIWIVGSHYVVYYGSPVLNALAFPWRMLPAAISGSTVPDLNMTYELFRRYPNRIGMGDWIGYLNLALKPWAFAFVGLYAWRFYVQIKSVRKAVGRKKLPPQELADNMASVFPEIAPVVSIQNQIVSNTLPEWRRQTFPEELLKGAKSGKNKPVLVIDTDSREQASSSALQSDQDRSLKVDEQRLIEFITATKTVKVGEEQVRFNRFLGNQIMNFAIDIGKNKKQICYPDRLSNVGKAIFAILAPHAFGSAKGKAQSKRVSDSLSLSAYGTKKGLANLALPVVQESYNQWRTHPLALNLAKIHHWEHTYLIALLEKARANGKIGTGAFIWLKPMSRILFYSMDDAGRKTPSSEGALAFSQFQFERDAVKRAVLPVHRNSKNEIEHTIFYDEVISAFVKEWELWRVGFDDSDDWWHDKKYWDKWEQNPVWQQAWDDINKGPNVDGIDNT